MIKKKQQKIYNVEADLSSILLGNAKNVFRIKHGNSLLGTLQFSRGSIQWYAPKTSIPIDFTWKQFADLMGSQKGV